MNPLCILCRQHGETSDHLFISCPVEKGIWESFPTTVAKPTNFSNLSHWFWETNSSFHRGLGITFAWYVWKMRNEAIFRYSPIYPSAVKQNTLYAMHEWNAADICSSSATCSGFPIEKCVPPPPQLFKLKFDVSYNPFSHTAGMAGWEALYATVWASRNLLL